MNETRSLASYATKLKPDSLPNDVIEYAKVLTVDLLGAAIYGKATEAATIVREQAVGRYRQGPVTLWGDGRRLLPAGAALVNATQGHAFELDDYHPVAKLHPGTVVIPAALAVASERMQLADSNSDDFRNGSSKGVPTGLELLAAIVAGYDAMIRVSLAGDSKSVRRRGWHLTGIAGPFGATVAAGRLHGVTESEMLNALGIAGSHAGGLFAFSEEGAMTKRIHAGRAAESGLLSTELARSGFTGPSQVLEAEDGGFLRAVSDAPVPDRIVAELGERFELTNTSIKPYSCCGSLHSSIDATLRIVERYDLNPSDIVSIVAKNSSLVDRQCGFEYRASGVLEAQMSLQYCLAVAAKDRAAFTEQFTPQRIISPELTSLAKCVRFELDPEIDEIYPHRFPARVAIETRSGRILEEYVSDPRGSVENRYKMSDVSEKFRRVTSDLIDTESMESLLCEIDDLEQGDVSALLKNLESLRVKHPDAHTAAI